MRAWCGSSGGRIELDTNTVERAIRPICLSRKNALFASSDDGGARWAAVASLVETCKLTASTRSGTSPNLLTRLVNGWPNSRIDELMPLVLEGPTKPADRQPPAARASTPRLQWPWTRAETDGLPAAERLLLDAIRAWRAAAAPLPALRLLLAAEDAVAAALPLDALLRSAPIRACAPLCPGVNQDEAALMLACALAQRGRAERGARRPAPPPAAARRLCRHAGRDPPRCALRAAGLLMRHPIREAMRPRPAARG